MASAANFVFCASWFSVFFLRCTGIFHLDQGDHVQEVKKKTPRKHAMASARTAMGHCSRFLNGENNFSGGPNFGSNVYSTRIVTCSYNLKLINCAKRSSWDQVPCEIVPVMSISCCWTKDHVEVGNLHREGHTCMHCTLLLWSQCPFRLLMQLS